jgi:hypothetical protein
MTFKAIADLADEKGWRIDLVYGVREVYGCTIDRGHWLAHMQGWVGQDPDPARAIQKCREAAADQLRRRWER